MSDLLTHSINVTAERAKLRALRDEIARDIAYREAIQRKYSPRGFPLLPDVQPLETQGKPSHGPAPHGALRPGAGLGVPAAQADMRSTQAGCCRRCGRPIGMAGEGVN